MKNLNLLNIPYDSKFFLVEEINFFNYEITEVYQIASKSSKMYFRYAIWENKKLKLLRNFVFPSRINLQGHEINIAVPFVRFKILVLKN